MKMSKINISYMTKDAKAYLYANIDQISQQLKNNPNDSSWLQSMISGQLFEKKKYEIEDFELSIPNDEKDRDTDFKNSITLYEHLKELPLYVLTDERFWLWINFDKGYRTALKYMPIEKGKSIFKDHWLFTQGKRRGLFFGVLSRCYFRVSLTVDQELKDPYFYTRFVIDKPERFRGLTWRTFSNETKIVHGALKAEKRVLDENPGMEERAEYFTEISKSISQLGSVMLLDVMSEKDIEEYVYKKYVALIEADEKERTGSLWGIFKEKFKSTFQ